LILKIDKEINDHTLNLFLKSGLISKEASLRRNSFIEPKEHSYSAKNVKDNLEDIDCNNQNKLDLTNIANRQTTAIDFMKTVLKTAEFALKHFQLDKNKKG
jgi:hypothetical protein